MDTPDRETLASLGRRVGWPSVSIYLPTHRAGNGKAQDPVRLRNLLGSVTEQLQSKGMRPTDSEVLLGRAYELLEDPTFWRDTGDGLAVFVAPGETTVLKLDTVLPEFALANDRFVIRHLLPSIRSQERFWLLALSKNELKLFEGDHAGMSQVPLRATPASFKEAMRFEDADHAFRFRTESGSLPQVGKRGSVFYGMGGLSDAEKDQVWRYVGMVERGVREATHESRAPLLLAGVEYIVSAYRAQNTYPNLVETTLFGNADEIPRSRLHAQALELLRPHFEAKRTADLAELESRSGSPVVSDDLREIVPAAHEGRVRVLFISASENDWGAYDPESGEVRVAHERGPSDWDLADLAATETILHGGDVHVLQPAEAQEPRPAIEPPVAILRY